MVALLIVKLFVAWQKSHFSSDHHESWWNCFLPGLCPHYYCASNNHGEIGSCLASTFLPSWTMVKLFASWLGSHNCNGSIYSWWNYLLPGKSLISFLPSWVMVKLFLPVLWPHYCCASINHGEIVCCLTSRVPTVMPFMNHGKIVCFLTRVS